MFPSRDKKELFKVGCYKYFLLPLFWKSGNFMICSLEDDAGRLMAKMMKLTKILVFKFLYFINIEYAMMISNLFWLS